MSTSWIHGGLIPPCPCGAPTEDQVPDSKTLLRTRTIELGKLAPVTGSGCGGCMSPKWIPKCLP